VPFDLGAYERTVLDALDRLLAGMIEHSGTATHHAVRACRDFDTTRRVLEGLCKALAVENRTISEATTAVHSGEPLL
jgi:hypothetical protein